MVREDGAVEFCVNLDQDKLHQAYGGIVPELASRNHLQHLLKLIDSALSFCKTNHLKTDLLSVTTRPGLVGSLLVGLVTTKTLSYLMNMPFVGVNHIHGHLLSSLLWERKKPVPPAFPFLALVVSGGHSHLFYVKTANQYRLIGKTLDDAVGETLDKVARILELEKPNGAFVDKTAQKITSGQKRKNAFAFPKTQIKKKGSMDFSFSGLKTFATQLIQKENIKNDPARTALFCFAFVNTIVEQILDRLSRSVLLFPDCRDLVICGGVSANSQLRREAKKWALEHHVRLHLPSPKFCTDNGAMIAYCGLKHFEHNGKDGLDHTCSPSSLPTDMTSDI